MPVKRRALVVVVFVLVFVCMPMLAFAGAVDDVRAGIEANRRGDNDEAIRLYTKALDSGSLTVAGQANTLGNRGIAYRSKGQFDRAIQDYDQAIRLQPDLAGLFLNRGAAYGLKGQEDRAIQDFEQAIKLKPDYAAAYSNRATAYKKLGQIDRAKADAKKARELDPKIEVPSFD